MADQVGGPVAILGMHRSGTSCLAGSLQTAGLFLGAVNEEAPHNAKGNRENRVIMQFHDELLAANDGSWDVPPAELGWNDQHERRLREIISAYPDDVAWGFKDPRTLVTLPLWLTVISELRFAGTFRHPVAVAQSLHARNGFSIERGIDLWLAYNQRLLSYQERFEFDLVNFDDDSQDYLRRVSSIANALNLVAADSGNTFFDNSLRHGTTDASISLPEPVATVYSRLLERSR